MSDLKCCNYCEEWGSPCRGHRFVETHRFDVIDYITLKMPDYELLYASEGCATVNDKFGNKYDVYFISDSGIVEVGIVSIELQGDV